MKKTILLTLLSIGIICFGLKQNAPVLAQSACPADAFLDVQPDPANSAYPDPQLSVSCSDSSMQVSSNGIPNYEFVAITPGRLTERDNNWSIPLAPSGTKEALPLLGDAGVLVNGIPIFGPNEGGNLGFGDPYLDDVLDFCNGHVGPSGYHNHATPECIFDDYENNVGLVVGYSLDGWPILAPFECADAACTQVVELQSSWQLTNPDAVAAWEKHSYVAGSGDLDDCNGKIQADGSYAYYSTATFPYFMGCYVNGDLASSEVAPLPANDAGGGPPGGDRPGGGRPDGPPPNGAPPADAPPAQAPAGDADCVIPPSGPWPPCATGGNVDPDSSGGADCVIPPSGPWPPCATGGTSEGAASDPNCVVPASGPWPACARRLGQ